MTAPYQVFVDGPRDRSPEAVARLAAAMAQRYGLPAPELERRLGKGRFKVKAGVDRATAEQYARDLELIGAVCTIVDASGATLEVAAAPAPAPRAAASLPPPGRGAGSALPPRTTAAPARSGGAVLPPRAVASAPARTAGASLPPRAPSASLPPRASSAPLATGLAAAKGSPVGADLGALGALGRDDGSIALSSLDGDVEVEPDERGESPGGGAGGRPRGFVPTSQLPASFGPAPTARADAPARAATGAGQNRDRDGTVDLFAAPDGEAEVELALDVVDRAPRGTSLPPPVSTATPPGGTIVPPLGVRIAAPPPAPVPALGARVRGVLANARIRFAAGVVVAILVGFVPAHLVAGIRERAAYAAIDERLHERYDAVAAPEDYDKLDQARRRALERKYSDRRDIALLALAIWAAAGAGLAYVWFRRVPWDRLASTR